MLCILQKQISSGICLLLPACPPHNTVNAASRSPSNPDTVPEEAGLKELQEKQPHDKMAVLVGSGCDGVVSPEDLGVPQPDNTEDSRPHPWTNATMQSSEQAQNPRHLPSVWDTVAARWKLYGEQRLATGPLCGWETMASLPVLLQPPPAHPTPHSGMYVVSLKATCDICANLSYFHRETGEFGVPVSKHPVPARCGATWNPPPPPQATYCWGNGFISKPVWAAQQNPVSK